MTKKSLLLAQQSFSLGSDHTWAAKGSLQLTAWEAPERRRWGNLGEANLSSQTPQTRENCLMRAMLLLKYKQPAEHSPSYRDAHSHGCRNQGQGLPEASTALWRVLRVQNPQHTGGSQPPTAGQPKQRAPSFLLLLGRLCISPHHSAFLYSNYSSWKRA